MPWTPRCSNGRLVSLPDNVRQWEPALRQVWRDRQHPHWPVHIILIAPTPTGSRHGGHLLILQHEHPGEAGVLISTSGSIADDRFAQLVPGVLHFERLLWFADQEVPCLQEQWHCVARHDRHVLSPNDPWRAENGQHIEIKVTKKDGNVLGPAPLPTTSAPSSSLEDFAFNPNAQPFVPGVATIEAMPEVIQDLHEEWLRIAFSWEGEEASAEITTWFVDQADRPQRICWQPRNVVLTSNFAMWEQEIKQRWIDRIIAGVEIEIALVTPLPPHHGRPVAAHVLVIQRPQPELVTSLITVYDITMPIRGPTMQMALTTFEHIFLEHIIHSLGLTQRCLLAGADRLCDAWYERQRLILGQPLQGRDGYGILMQLAMRPIVQAPDQVAFLQTSAQLLPNVHRQESDDVQSEEKVTICLDDCLEELVAVTLINGLGRGPLPDHVEVSRPAIASKVQAELLNWGHQCQVLDCEYGNYFLCAEAFPDTTDGVVHYVFVHDDAADANGVFLHSEPSCVDETRLQEMLCMLEYPRAVIMQNRQMSPQWYCIIFHHREPQVQTDATKPRTKTAWPSRFDHQRTGDSLIDLALISNISAQCQLDTAFTVQDFEHLFGSTQGCLCLDTEVLNLPEEMRDQLRNIEHRDLSDVRILNDYDRLLIFTDGSSQPRMRRCSPLYADECGAPDTWAFAVVGERFGIGDASDLTFFGWAAHPIRYDPAGDAYTGITHIGSDQAERDGLIGAGLWRIAQNHAIPTVFCCDAVLAGGQAFGNIGTASVDDSFRLLRGIFQALESALPHGDLRWHHTRAHTGELFNELVDTAAKHEAQKSYNIKRQQLCLPAWHAKLCQLWTAFGEKYGLPRWADGFLDVGAPALPDPSDPNIKTQITDIESRTSTVQFCLSVASANVQSLYRGPDGHAGKLHYLQEQMRMFRLNCIAIQEARSERGMSCNGNILRLCSGHANGHGGIEIWIDLECPYAYDRRGRGILFKKSQFQVVCATERCLFVHCVAGSWSFWLVALHAPHSGHSADTRNSWWRTIDEMLTLYLDGDPLFMMIDANCAPGDADGVVVQEHGFATTTNTVNFRALLGKHGLCLPSTTPKHHGGHATWTSVDGLTSHCIDYVAIPQTWQECCTHSQTLSEFDLANVNEDHQAVAIQLQWHANLRRQTVKSPDQQLRRSEDYVPHEGAHYKILNHQGLTWGDDVEKHTQTMTSHLHQVMAEHKQNKPGDAKKPYVDEELWKLRQGKLMTQKQLKEVKRRLTFNIAALCFRAWRTRERFACVEEELQYHITLRCHIVSTVVRLTTLSRTMRTKMRKTKCIVLQKELDQIGTNTSASEILQKLRKFVGPTNPNKFKRPQLPWVKSPDGVPCRDPNEALSIWIDFFQQMEGGSRMHPEQLRNQWIRELANFRQHVFHGDLESLPSLTDLEVALRRIPKGKARGPDGIPGELCRYQPAAVARILYAHVIKIGVHGQEPLEFIGGRLTAAYKGRGPTDECRSYRSLLISNHLGKAVHRTLRMKYAPLYERFLQAQQTGGRRRVPVQLPLHQVRAFARHAKNVGQSAAILYLDLQEAFYRIVREAPLGGEVTDEFMGFLAHKMNLPDDSLHQLFALLNEPSALKQAGFNAHQQRCLQAIHTGTFFWMQGQTDVSRTTVGTRPGDCMADLIFGFAWACVLRKLEGYMTQIGALSEFPLHAHLPLFGCCEAQATMCSYMGPTWMDDLAVCTLADTPARLVSQISGVTGHLLDLCAFHCMQPNLAKGKTELMMTFRGTGSRQARIQYYGPQADSYLTILRENETSRIPLVCRYKHLGCVSHHTGDQAADVHVKAAVGHSTFNQHKKILFGNQNIALAKRTEIFQMIVLSKCLYGAETWVAMNDKTMKKFHAMIIRLYRRLLPAEEQLGHLEDDAVLTRVALPSPLELLHRARLRYLATLVRANVQDAWALLATDHQWLGLVEQALTWMWEQLSGSSTLPDPRQDYQAWLSIIQNSPGYWKRLVRRAGEHSILHRAKHYQVRQFHAVALHRIREACSHEWGASDEEGDEVSTEGVFGCLHCAVRCRSRAGEAAHMCKAHAQVSRLRSLFDSPTCPICMKHFHTHAKMKAHLYYSARCRTGLESANMHCAAVPGSGSLADAHRDREHDRVLPPLPVHGPRPREPRARETVVYNEELYDYIVQIVTEHFHEYDMDAQIRGFVQMQAISWTDFCGTLLYFKSTFDVDDARVLQIDLTVLRDILHKLIDPSTWPFLEKQKPRKLAADIDTYHQRCEVVEENIMKNGVVRCQRSVGKHRVLLHAYSGRRRVGDLQYFIEQAAATRSDYMIHVVSLDIVVDTTWGDASNPSTREFWLSAIRSGYVLAFVGGPPCETWSRARGQVLAGASKSQGPRIIRDAVQLWGHDQTTIKEALQLITGNTLLCFALLAILELALVDGFGVLEHPAEPEDAPEKASIWRLPVVKALLAMEHVTKIRFAQGLMGSASPKPTHLLVVNMPGLLMDLHRNRVRKELPKAHAIGKDHKGHWRTTALKEYAPAFCKSMSEAIIRAFDSCESQHQALDVPAAFLQRCTDMNCQDFGDFVGADFAG